MATVEERNWIEEHRLELVRRSTAADDKAIKEARAAANEAEKTIPDPQIRVLVRLLADLMARDEAGRSDARLAELNVVAIAGLLKTARETNPGS